MKPFKSGSIKNNIVYHNSNLMLHVFLFQCSIFFISIIKIKRYSKETNKRKKYLLDRVYTQLLAVHSSRRAWYWSWWPLVSFFFFFTYSIVNECEKLLQCMRSAGGLFSWLLACSLANSSRELNIEPVLSNDAKSWY